MVLHASMSFLPGLGAQGWPITEGFFGRMLLHRDGVRAFVSNRSTRVVIPLVVGWIVFFPMIATAKPS